MESRRIRILVYNNSSKGQGRGKGKGGKTNATTQCHIYKKFGHVAANCWYKDSTYTTAVVGSGTTGQTQHFSMDHPTNDQPVALMLRDQLPLYSQHGQCISGSYMQATIAPRAATSSTVSYIRTPGPVLHDISHVYCEEIDDYYKHNVLEINYNQQLTNGMNHNYARELPAHYLKHWGLLVDTGAYVSVAPSISPQKYCWSQYYIPFSFLQLHLPPSRSTGQKQYYWFLEGFHFMFASMEAAGPQAELSMVALLAG